jgi:hypothetical protein
MHEMSTHTYIAEEKFGGKIFLSDLSKLHIRVKRLATSSFSPRSADDATSNQITVINMECEAERDTN